MNAWLADKELTVLPKRKDRPYNTILYNVSMKGFVVYTDHFNPSFLQGHIGEYATFDKIRDGVYKIKWKKDTDIETVGAKIGPKDVKKRYG